MKIVATFILAAFFAAPGVQARTWTNAEGKTLEADLVKVADGQVYLRLDKDRKVHPLKIETLSESDQEFIRQYEKDQAARQKTAALAKRKAKWLTDYDDVKAESEQLGLPILLLYTAPDWCSYCVVLEDNILSQAVFKEYAKANLVLFLADFSKTGDAEDWAKKHPQLKADFPCSGYPCAYLISPDGKKLGSISGCDSAWTPKDYIERLEKHKANAN